MLIKTHNDGRVLGAAELGGCNHWLDRHFCGPIIRGENLGRVVRCPSLQLGQRIDSLGERRWVTRGEGQGRVVPREWLIESTHQCMLGRSPATEPMPLGRPPGTDLSKYTRLPEPTRAA